MQSIRKLELFILFVLVSLALSLYLFKLEGIPSGFYIDEAMPGYSAYSLMETGRDEYGKTWPIALRFFGSYNPPLYTFLVIPSIKIFGLSIFAVRLPAAIIGIIFSIAFYIFAKSLKITNNAFSLFISMLFLILSPWLLLYSRVGYEVGLGLLLFTVGVMLFWKSLTNINYILLGLLFFSLSTYAAYTERFLAPIFIVCFLLLNKSYFLKHKEIVLKSLLLTGFTQIPNFYLLTTPAFFPKADLFYGDVESQVQKLSQFLPHALSYILVFIREFLSKFFTFLSPRSLFFLPDPDPQRSLPELSVFYPWMLIPYIWGIYDARENKRKKSIQLIILLLLLTPIPAALTNDPFSTHRGLPALLPLMLIITLGINRLMQNVKTLIFLPIFSLLLIISGLMLWRSYFVFLPQERAKVWGFGFQELAREIESHPENHYLIDQTRIKPAYSYLAFFTQYPPSKFQQEVDPSILVNYYSNPRFNNKFAFGNIETGVLSWETDIYEKQIIVGDVLTISEGQAKEHFLTREFTILDPLNQPVFIAYRTNPEEKCKSPGASKELCHRSNP